MDLLGIRTKFRSLSGRFDLVNADFSDNGADFFINEGRKFLDRLDETQKSWATVYRLVAIGFSSVSFPYCRAIKEVWAASITQGRWQLTKKSLQDMMEGYLTGLPSSRNQGTPLYYSPCITRHVPEDVEMDDFEAFMGFVEVPMGDAHEYNTIILNVPADVQLMLTVNGLFYSHYLEEDTDKNYWSEVHPMLLIMAASRQAEIVNRNTQGVNDWTNAIAVDMKQIGMDLVEELIAEVDQMEG